ncbi:MAG: hypothetical protein O9301_04085 [Leptospira sp.]|nr:hypothetical protein [Leptospira sp.]
MRIKFSKFFILLSFIGCSSIDFIPEPEYTRYHSRYQKKDWEEIEILRERPTKPFQILGDIVIRNPEGLPFSDFVPSIKKDLFERKLDGVWMVEKRTSVVDNMSVHTMDSRGRSTNTYESRSTVPVWKGFAFRYK